MTRALVDELRQLARLDEQAEVRDRKGKPLTVGAKVKWSFPDFEPDTGVGEVTDIKPDQVTIKPDRELKVKTEALVRKIQVTASAVILPVENGKVTKGWVELVGAKKGKAKP